jgi:hypothetical protein
MVVKTIVKTKNVISYILEEQQLEGDLGFEDADYVTNADVMPTYDITCHMSLHIGKRKL